MLVSPFSTGFLMSVFTDSVISRMTLLLGPPGAGKTTLLLALAGKLDEDLRVRIQFSLVLIYFLPFLY